MNFIILVSLMITGCTMGYLLAQWLIKKINCHALSKAKKRKENGTTKKRYNRGNEYF